FFIFSVVDVIIVRSWNSFYENSENYKNHFLIINNKGKSTLACSLSRELYTRGNLSYILDGDNLRHGLNKDLGFKADDRTENIRRVGEVAKLFADAGLICIASLISPYRKDRDACRAMLPDANFIEARLLEDGSHLDFFYVFMNMPLELCEARDSKGLYKLARAGKIKGVLLTIIHSLTRVACLYCSCSNPWRNHGGKL
ncbi:hypothetical protein QQP08_015260, partial [Theobroma cacao]